ncbi:MAG: TIGR01777 family oxidoreductase [Candidatus Zixiibacteriota bacterium]
MKILISGASGLIGSALTKKLHGEKHAVVRLVRSEQTDSTGRIAWRPEKGALDPAALERFDAVINLAGENIAARRWNKKQKARIEQSRVAGTQLLARTLASLQSPPEVFISASAVGIYGDRGDEPLDETSPPGESFLAEVCKKWENATIVAREKGIRVVNLRIGTVLAAEGGALPKMITPFKLGLGGKFGSGRQYMSWIALEDLIEAVVYIINKRTISGPVNLVSPDPVTNAEFTKILARKLHRPAFFTVPAFVLKLAAGEMAGPLLLASARVNPTVLIKSGFKFNFPDLRAALAQLLA